MKREHIANAIARIVAGERCRVGVAPEHRDEAEAAWAKLPKHLRDRIELFVLDESERPRCECCRQPIMASDVAEFVANGGSGIPSHCVDCAERDSFFDADEIAEAEGRVQR